MTSRIIRIAATLAGCILLSAGCSLKSQLDTDGTAIRFTAGSVLLRDDATKGGELKTGTEFAKGDKFRVWAWHSAVQQHLTFGTDQLVTLQDDGTWDYAPHLFWNWQEGTDYYDFLAVYPGDQGFTHPAPDPNSPTLTANVTYNAVNAQYDLMAAGRRRTEHITTIVPLEFQHMLSAVSVKVKNASGSVDEHGDPLSITLQSCRFVNLVTESTIQISFDGDKLSSSRGASAQNTNSVLGPAIPDNTALAPGSSHPETAEWDIMVPQDLGTEQIGSVAPYLHIVYTKGAEAEENVIDLPLKDIKDSTTKQEITSWKAGVRYQYEIEIKLGGGILVNVRTTPWEIVEAETPGLMI